MGFTVGLIGIESNFKGTVYNLNNSSFSYEKQRPFYVFALGSEVEVAKLMDKIQTKFDKSAQTLAKYQNAKYKLGALDYFSRFGFEVIHFF